MTHTPAWQVPFIMPSSELTNWQAIFSNEDEDAKKREEDAKKNAAKTKSRRR